MGTDIIKAYAKVNLALTVKNKRKDGYHNLDMIMSTIELHDVLYINENDSGKITVAMSNDICAEQDNLCYKIIKYIKTDRKITKGINLFIEKNIPDGAGLGGGSADAAAVLLYLNEKWHLGYSGKQLLKIGAMYGSDIPFCLIKQMSRVLKKGEKIIKLKKQRDDAIIVIVPDFKLRTKDVFAKCIPSKTSHMTKFLKELNKGSLSEIYNELEIPANEVSGGMISTIIKRCKSLGAYNTIMTGSGSSIITIVEHDKVQQMEELLNREFPQYKIITTRLKMYTS